MKFYIFLFMVLFMVGCGSKTPQNHSPKPFRYFFDNDANLKKISFKREVSEQEKYNKTGVARVERSNLGTMYETANHSYSIIMTNKQINPNNQDEISSLKNSQTIKFYEFNQGNIQSINFNSQNQVCTSLQKGEKIDIKSVNNYYANHYDFSQNDDDLFASFMLSSYENYELAVSKYSFLQYINDDDTKQKVAALVYDDKFKQVLGASLQRQVQILKFLCEL
ncbi:hypothetical protein [Campylobacter majalis]|uniref:hypothetical protein n=1 Tax=Campylobacter majalis TaxID=2790656 RepID=UPI003D6938A8